MRVPNQQGLPTKKMPALLREFKQNSIAGIIVGVMLVPQSMAYASLAGLPPISGLYGAALAPIVFALISPNPTISMGPVAIDSMLIGAMLLTLSQKDPTLSAIAIASALTLGTAAIQLLGGLFRLGFLAKALSPALLKGFIPGAAVLILLSQVKYLAGITPAPGHTFLAMVTALSAVAEHTHLLTLIISLLAVVFLIVSRQTQIGWARFLILVIVTISAAKLIGLEDLGIKMVTATKGGLPPLISSLPSFGTLLLYWPNFIILALVGFAGTTAIDGLTRPTKPSPPNRQLLALGVANALSGLFSGYCVSAGFSRSAVNKESGASTALSSLVTSLFLLITLLVLMPAFRFLPMAALGAIVFTAVWRLIKPKEMLQVWTENKREGIVLFGAFLSVLVLGVTYGLVSALFIRAFILGLTRLNKYKRPNA